MNPDNKGRADLVSVITTPLGFFALSLLIVEGFLGIILIGSGGKYGLTAHEKYVGLFIGAGLFLLVVLVVVILVWFKPQHLTFSERSHIEHDKILGDATNQVSEKELATEPKVVEAQAKKMGQR